MNPTSHVMVEVDQDLTDRLADLAGALQQAPGSIVNRVLREYLDSGSSPDRGEGTKASRATYLELTAREELRDLF